jgi:hypothetical protein
MFKLTGENNLVDRSKYIRSFPNIKYENLVLVLYYLT